MATVLERLGYQLDFPEDQTCCGQPAFNSGYRAEARVIARHFLDVFESSETIVVPSGSCTAMVVHHFAELFHKEPETLQRVNALEKRVWEFSAFLTDSFEFCNQAVASMTPDKLSAEVGPAGRKMTGFEWLWSYFTHTAHHRGQAEVYLRVKGIKPPEYVF